MPKCHKCSTENKYGVLICESCGTALYGAFTDTVATSQPQDDSSKKTLVTKILSFLSKTETKVFGDEAPTQQITPVVQELLQPENRPEDPSVFMGGTNLLLRVNGSDIVVDNPRNDIWLGRFGGKTPPPRDIHTVNLADYGGYQLGISRLHAIMRPTQDNHLLLIDMASSNGTFLNGYKLNPHELFHVYDGDEIHLGQLRLLVYFLYR